MLGRAFQFGAFQHLAFQDYVYSIPSDGYRFLRILKYGHTFNRYK